MAVKLHFELHMTEFEFVKTIGLVCDDVPFVVNPKGPENFLVTSVENYFVVY